MKPNDKAYREFMRVFTKTHLDKEAQIMASLTAAFAAQFQSEDYAGLVKELKHSANFAKREDGITLCKAAYALEVLLVEREAERERFEHFGELHHQEYDRICTERDEWKKQAEICRDRMQETEITLGKYVQERAACKNGDGQFTLENTFQSLLDMIDLEVKTAHEKIAAIEERDAAIKERDALAARLAPVEDIKLSQIGSEAIYKMKLEVAIDREASEEPCGELGDPWSYIDESDAVIAAIRPHIEAAERERCANVAELCWTGSPDEIAAAIRSGK